MSTPGFYGKLACRGDFVSRGLPQSFVQPWDAWLAAGILASQQQLGSGWLDAYLVSPLWRFALAPDVCGPDAIVGVLMPSIDRVGRYFPLTLAFTIDVDQTSASAAGCRDDWFERVEDLLLSTLEAETSFDAFDTGVHALGVPSLNRRHTSVEFAGLHCVSATSPEERIAALAEQACVGASLWWGKGSETIKPGLLRCHGLPAAADFGRYLLGKEATR